MNIPDLYAFSKSLRRCQNLARANRMVDIVRVVTSNLEATNMNTPIDISSIGFLCQQLQTPIGRIRAAADQLGIKASFLNGVSYFDAQAVELIRAELRAAILTELRLQESPAIRDQRSGIQ